MLANITMREYLTHPGISSSKLKYMLQTPADFKAAMAQNLGETKSTMLGTAVHCAILEPHLFDDQYALQPDDWGPKNKGEGYRKWRQFKEDNIHKTCLSWEDRLYIDRIRTAAEGHSYLQTAMKYKIGTELSAFCATDCDYYLKIRPDILSKFYGCNQIISDLKTSFKGVGDSEISRTIFTMGYHFAAAQYIHVMKENLSPVDHYDWIFLATDTPAPHIIVKRASKDMLAAGQKDFEHALKLLEKCAKTNEWPGYPQDVQEIDLPPFTERFYL